MFNVICLDNFPFFITLIINYKKKSLVWTVSIFTNFHDHTHLEFCQPLQMLYFYLPLRYR